MKLRHGFVSNSSSSSYVCDVCGADASGMDMCLSDAGMKRCQLGHYFCEGHAINKNVSLEDKKAYLIEAIKDNSCYESAFEELTSGKEVDDFEDLYNEIVSDIGSDSKICPICQFKAYDTEELLQYMLCHYKTTTKEALAEIKKEFGDYKTFKAFLKANKETK